MRFCKIWYSLSVSIILNINKDMKLFELPWWLSLCSFINRELIIFPQFVHRSADLTSKSEAPWKMIDSYVSNFRCSNVNRADSFSIKSWKKLLYFQILNLFCVRSHVTNIHVNVAHYDQILEVDQKRNRINFDKEFGGIKNCMLKSHVTNYKD